jgi:hypothetical protein
MEASKQGHARGRRPNRRKIVNAAKPRARTRAIVHPPIEAAAPSMLSMDLLVAGFAIIGALLMSFLR